MLVYHSCLYYCQYYHYHYCYYYFFITVILIIIIVIIFVIFITHPLPSSIHLNGYPAGNPLGIRLQSTTAVLGRDSYVGIMDCAKSMLRHEGVG